MNENQDRDATNLAATVSPGVNESCRQRKQAGYWLKRLLACNPFYVGSAALLLYGVYRVSADPTFLPGEVTHLAFNFTWFQVYELLLAGTAIFLARRRIQYDSNLLVGLENLLVLVPFILISQAALIDARIVWGLSVLAMFLAAVRFGGMRWLIAELPWTNRFLSLGAALLATNGALPVVYRSLHENKFGTRLEAGPAYVTNECVWLFLLPALCALAYFVPACRTHGETTSPRAWLPGVYSLWLAATGVHLYCLGYIYDFALRPELLAPTLWALCWTAQARVPEFASRWQAGFRRALWVAAGVAPLAAIASSGSAVLVVLALANAMVFTFLAERHPSARIARHLAIASLICVAGQLPSAWVGLVWNGYSRTGGFLASVALYLLGYVWLTRDPRLGIAAGLALGTGVLVALGDKGDSLHWALQAGLVWLLLHSLRWIDDAHAGSTLIRWLACVGWLGDSLFWQHEGASVWFGPFSGGIVLSWYLIARRLTARWGPRVVAWFAGLVIVSGLLHDLGGKLTNAPIGVIAVLGSFGLFALGTAVALTKHRWHSEHKRTTGDPLAREAK